MRKFTATLTDSQYVYVKGLGKMGLSRLIQQQLDAKVPPKRKRWWRSLIEVEDE